MHNRLSHLNTFLFRNGFGFLLPFTAFYYSFYIAALPVPALSFIFDVLLILTSLLFILFVSPFFTQKQDKSSMLWWALLFFLFLLPGAFLEYPSDPYEHIRRIFIWDRLHLISHHELPTRFAYFFSWSILKHFPLDARFLGLSLVSAFYQLLLSYQIYRLGKYLHLPPPVCYLASFFFPLFTGSHVMSFRYYALASTSLAYLFYLASIGVLLELLKGSKRNVILLPILYSLCFFNHLQEFLFCLISAGVILLFHFAKTRKKQQQSSKLYFAFTLCFLLLWLFYESTFTSFLHTPLGLDSFFDEHSRYFKALGVAGFLTLLLSLLFLFKYPLLAILTLSSTFLLLFPPSSALILSIVSSEHIAYRILYCFPFVFILCTGVYNILSRIFARARTYVVTSLSALSLLLLASNPASPWYGRLPFQFYKLPQASSHADIKELTPWISEHLAHCDISQKWWLVTDNVTYFILGSHLGWPMNDYEKRRKPISLTDPTFLESTILTPNRIKKVCALLLPLPDKIPPHEVSWIGKATGHWNEALTDRKNLVSPAFLDKARSLKNHDWEEVQISSTYVAYINKNYRPPKKKPHEKKAPPARQ